MASLEREARKEAFPRYLEEKGIGRKRFENDLGDHRYLIWLWF
jgi:hypothetical protein